MENMGRKRYDAAFRIRAIKLVEEVGCGRAEAILGVSARGLRNWMRLPLSGESMKKEISPELSAALLEADEAKKEAKRLRKENEELKTANLILKEVASVFSRDPLRKNLRRSLNSKVRK
jgi:transposase-like protein